MNQSITRMKNKAQQALHYAYAPYSKFTVAACLCSEKDTLFTGVNVENSAFGLCVCAETTAICCMVASGELRIKSMLVLAGNHAPCPPCGACRQRIHEFAMPDTCIYLCGKDETVTTLTLQELLPMPFSLTPFTE